MPREFVHLCTSLTFLLGIAAIYDRALADESPRQLREDLSIEGTILEARLRTARVHPALWEVLAEEGAAPVTVIVAGGLSRDYVSAEDFAGLLKVAGEEQITGVSYPVGFEALLSEADVRALLEHEHTLFVDFSREFVPLLEDVVEIIDAVGVWEVAIGGIPITGFGQTVAIIDSGIDFDHPDLAAKNIVGANLNCFDGPECFVDFGISDSLGHGTNMAGIIGASGGVTGVAKGADLIGLAISFRNFLEVLRAVVWCCENAQEYNISVINLSLGSTEVFFDHCSGGALENAIDLAVEQNIAVVAGSGNSGNSSGIAMPACFRNVIPVAASLKNDQIWPASNYNELVKIFAPAGADVRTTRAGGTYRTSGGTSAPTAVTSGAIALLKQFLALVDRPNSMSPAELEQLLFDTGDSLVGFSADPWRRIGDTGDPVVGLSADQWRRIDIGEALRSFMTRFVRGDVTQDRRLDIFDAAEISRFLSGDAVLLCEDAADVNDDQAVDVSDIVYVLQYLFLQGPPPPPPFDFSGEDRTADALRCFD